MYVNGDNVMYFDSFGVKYRVGQKKKHSNFNLQILVNHRFLFCRILCTEYTFYLKYFVKFCERSLLKTIKYGML